MRLGFDEDALDARATRGGAGRLVTDSGGHDAFNDDAAAYAWVG